MAIGDEYLLAVVSGSVPGDVDLVLANVARALQAQGLRVAGAIQTNTDRPGRRCDMTLTILPDETEFKISEDRGRLSTGCRLDAGGLSSAVHALEAQMSRPYDAMILNKFGAREVEGEGFVPALAEALIANVPTLIGVGDSKRGALESFLDAPVRALPLCEKQLVDWVLSARKPVSA